MHIVEHYICDGQEHYIVVEVVVVHNVEARDGQGRNGSSIPQLRPITTLQSEMTTFSYLFAIINIIVPTAITHLRHFSFTKV